MYKVSFSRGFLAVMVAAIISGCGSEGAFSGNSSSESDSVMPSPPTDSPAMPTNGVVKIFSSKHNPSFLATRADGSVVTWGSPVYGGDSSSVDFSSGVKDVVFSWSNVAAVKNNGDVVSWGRDSMFDTRLDPEKFTGKVARVDVSKNGSFVATQENGSVVAWGDPGYPMFDLTLANGPAEQIHINAYSAIIALRRPSGEFVTWGELNVGIPPRNVDLTQVDRFVSAGAGSSTTAFMKDMTIAAWGNGNHMNTSGVDLTGHFQAVYANGYAYFGIKVDGTVVAWGPEYFDNVNYGHDTTGVDFNGEIKAVIPSASAFAILKEDGSVVSWGASSGLSGIATPELSRDVVEVIANSSREADAFAALKADGSVVTWGDPTTGGDSSAVDFSGGVEKIISTSQAFAAIKKDGTVVAWGNPGKGGDVSHLDFSAGIKELVANSSAFAALMNDGSVITWGDAERGGDSSGIDWFADNE